MKSEKRTLLNLRRVEGRDDMSLKAFARVWASRDRRWCSAQCDCYACVAARWLAKEKR